MHDSLPQVAVVPRIDLSTWNSMPVNARSTRPVVITNALADTTAVRTWTPDLLAERYAGIRSTVAIGIPDRGSAFDAPFDHHARSMPVDEFVEFMRTHERCYLYQATLKKWPGLAEEIEHSHLLSGPTFSSNLWLGRSTRSGLHFDWADGVLMQIYGTKTVMMTPPSDFSRMYVYPDAPNKSRVSPDDLDLKKYPRFAGVQQHNATISPGDALIIPRHWWHHVISEGTNISVNTWYGYVDPLDRWRTILRAGPVVCAHFAYNFVFAGMLGRKRERRLFRARSEAEILYSRLQRGIERSRQRRRSGVS